MMKDERVTLADDIASLRGFSDTAEFDYVDVSASEAQREALAYWPLMASLDAWRQSRGSKDDAVEQGG